MVTGIHRWAQIVTKKPPMGKDGYTVATDGHRWLHRSHRWAQLVTGSHR